MKRIKRSIVILIALGMIVSIAMVIPASAQTSSEGRVKVQDSEFVFAEMDYTGEITGIQVFDWLELSGDGTVEVKEAQAVEGDTSWQGVKGTTKPKTEGGYLVWPELSVNAGDPRNVIANTKFSEAQVEEAKMKIPLDVDFRFYFDGAPVTDVGTITGKDGRFKMEVTFKNDSAEMTEVEYEDPVTGEMVVDRVETHLPMVILPYDWYFDNSIFFNLEADPTGVVVWMPDFYNVGWSIPLFPPATGESHTISVAADVKNFQLPPLTIAVAFEFPQTNQEDPFVFIKPGMEQIYDGLKSLNEGLGDAVEGVGTPSTSDTLLYGITAVDDGLQQLAAGLPEAVTNIDAAMIPGVDQIIAGIGSPTTPDTLLYASAATTAGLQGISAGIGSATTPDTLLYAIDAIITNLQAISAGLGTATNPATIIGGVYAVMIGLGYDPGTPGVLQGLQQISAGLGSTSTVNTIIWALDQIQLGLANPLNPNNIYNALMGGVQQMLDPVTAGTIRNLVDTSPTMNPAEIAVLDATMNFWGTNVFTPSATGVQTMYGYLTAPLPNGIIANLQYIKGTAIDGGLIPGVQQMLAGLPLIYGGLVDIRNGIGTTTTMDTLLYAAAAIEGGLNATKAGIGDPSVPDTLLYAVAAIQGGLVSIREGLSTGNLDDPGIREGLILISQGLTDAVQGLGSAGTPDTLLYGSNAVAGGLGELGTGLGTAADGSQQLVDGVGSFVEAFNMSDAELEAIAMRGEEFDHLLGRAENAKNNVRLVYAMNPTYNYPTGNSTSWIVAIVLSVIIALILVAGGIILARSKGTA